MCCVLGAPLVTGNTVSRKFSRVAALLSSSLLENQTVLRHTEINIHLEKGQMAGRHGTDLMRTYPDAPGWGD